MKKFKKKLSISAAYMVIYAVFMLAFFLVLLFADYCIKHNVFVKRSSLNDLNSYRYDNDVQVIKENKKLDASAQQSAREIATGKRGWSHDGYTAEIQNSYGDFKTADENLGKGYENFQQVLIAWKNSPEHNKVLLDKGMCEYGIGHDQNVWVLHEACKR